MLSDRSLLIFTMTSPKLAKQNMEYFNLRCKITKMDLPVRKRVTQSMVYKVHREIWTRAVP